jgi:hypothetical protein
VNTTEDLSIRFDAVADDTAVAVGTNRRQRVDCTLEAIEGVTLSAHDDFKRLAGVAKLGATLGAFLLPILKEKFGVPTVLGVMSAVSLLGLIVTFALRREDTDSPLFGIVETGGK